MAQTNLVHHRATIGLILLSQLTKGPYRSLRVQQQCWEVIISSKVAVAFNFMRARHAKRYLQSKRPTILVSEKRLRTCGRIITMLFNLQGCLPRKNFWGD